LIAVCPVQLCCGVATSAAAPAIVGEVDHPLENCIPGCGIEITGKIGHYCTRSASEMTYIVSGGALNSTHSLTHCTRIASLGRNVAFQLIQLNWLAPVYRTQDDGLIDEPSQADDAAVCSPQRSTCRAHVFWLCRACRTAWLDSLETLSSTGSTR